MSSSDTLEDLPEVSVSNENKPLFTPELVLDSRLCIRDSLPFAIQKSASQITYHSQQASSATTSGITFDIVVPSLSTIISRKMNLKSKLTFTVTGTPAAGEYLVNWGVTTALAPLPVHQLSQTINWTLNSSNYTLEVGDLLPQLLRCLEKKTLNEYAGTCPTFLDNYARYGDAVGRRNSMFNGYDSAFVDEEGRGSYNVQITGNSVGDGDTIKTVTIVVNVCEPIIMSPFILSTYKDENSQGLYGIQSMSANFQFNNSNLSRAIRGVFPAGTTVQLSNVLQPSDVSLELCYLTPHPSLRMPARNICDYYQLQQFKFTTPQIAGGAANPYGYATNASGINKISSNSYQLNMCPDKVLVCVRRVTQKRDSTQPDCFLPITGVNINFNNCPGICSNMSTSSLWEASKKNGVNLSYNEFLGYSTLQTAQQMQVKTGAAFVANAPLNVVNPVVAIAPVPVATTGSLLCLAFGPEINIVNDWIAPSSIGTFSFQIDVSVWDNTQLTGNGTVPPLPSATDYELSLVFFNSGLIVSSLGASSTYLGLLSKQEVLQTSKQAPINKASVERVYGSGKHSHAGMGRSAGSSGGKMSAGSRPSIKDRLL